MNIFQYPNQNAILTQNIARENIGRQIKFLIYNKKGFPVAEKQGVIFSTNNEGYIVKCGKKYYLVHFSDYVSIF